MSLEMIQVIKPDGTVVDSALEPKLSAVALKQLYHYMVLTRQLDERGLMLQRQGRIGFYVTCTGQEAIVGSGLALEASDWVFPAYREHAVGLIRGLPLEVLIAQLFGNSEDLLKGRQMPKFLPQSQPSSPPHGQSPPGRSSLSIRELLPDRTA